MKESGLLRKVGGGMSGIKDSVKNVYNHVKRNVGKYVVAGALAGALSTTPRADALTVPFGDPSDWERFNDFSEYMSSSSSKHLMMEPGTNLTYEGVADGSFYKVGFLDGSGAVVGHAENRANTVPGYEGWIDGDYSSDLGGGNKPTYMIIGRDVDNDGFWRHIPTSSIYGDEGDLVVGNNNIWLGNIGDSLGDLVQGDMSKLPAYVDVGDIANFGPIDIRTTVIPEPASVLLFLTGAAAAGAMSKRKQ